MGCGPKALLDHALAPAAQASGASLEVEEIAVAGECPGEIQAAFSLCRQISQCVHRHVADHRFPIVLSGNCNAAVGALAGLRSPNTGVIWFDAHGESTTPETTTSGFLDGMGISIMTGQCWRSLAGSIPGFKPLAGNKLLLIGARDLSPDEIRLQDEIGVIRAESRDLAQQKIGELAEQVDSVYLHFDFDVLDPAEGTANQWRVPHGLSLHDILAILGTIRAQLPVHGFGIASYDPAQDTDRRVMQAAAAVTRALLV